MSYSRNGAGTIGGTTAYVGQLIVDLYDGATAALVWREVVRAWRNPLKTSEGLPTQDNAWKTKRDAADAIGHLSAEFETL